MWALTSLVYTLVCHVSRRFTEASIALGIESTFRAVVRWGGNAQEAQSARATMPLGSRAILKRFNFGPRLVSVPCCPDCFHLFEATDAATRPARVCGQRVVESSQPCSTPLYRLNRLRQEYQPAKVLHFASFDHWLARFLARSEVNDMLEDYYATRRSTNGKLASVWDGSVFRSIDLRYPDGTKFLSSPYDLVFGLYADWFNCFGNKSAGKAGSTGLVCYVCYNLPTQVRWRPENLFITTIMPGKLPSAARVASRPGGAYPGPGQALRSCHRYRSALTPSHPALPAGPTEPSKTQMDHLLYPSVQEMLSYSPLTGGVWMSRTARQRGGVRVGAIVGPVIGDLPAVRKMIGFTAPSSKYNICPKCKASQIQTGSTDPTEWGKRSDSDWHSLAQGYQATTDKAAKRQAEFVTENGVRTTCLLDLPYWSPTSSATIDPMHCFQNASARLFRQHWGTYEDKPSFSREARNAGVAVFNASPEEAEDDGEPDPLQEGDLPVPADPLVEAQRLQQQAWPNVYTPERLQAEQRDADRRRRESSAASFASEPVQSTSAQGSARGPANLVPNTVFKNVATARRPQARVDPLTDIPVDPVPPNPGQSEALAYIIGRDDIRLLQTFCLSAEAPASLGRLPRKLGTKQAGKLKADQYHLLTCVFMPVYLAARWQLGADRSSRSWDLFSSLAHLASAQMLLRQRVTSASLLARATHHLKEYTRLIKKIDRRVVFPGNHHALLEMPRVLAEYGTAHGIWCFPAERLNGDVVRLPNNHIPGQLEVGALRFLTTKANLLAYIQSPAVAAEDRAQLVQLAGLKDPVSSS